MQSIDSMNADRLKEAVVRQNPDAPGAPASPALLERAATAYAAAQRANPLPDARLKGLNHRAQEWVKRSPPSVAARILKAVSSAFELYPKGFRPSAYHGSDIDLPTLEREIENWKRRRDAPRPAPAPFSAYEWIKGERARGARLVLIGDDVAYTPRPGADAMVVRATSRTLRENKEAVVAALETEARPSAGPGAVVI